jgi:hypothetical protein
MPNDDDLDGCCDADFDMADESTDDDLDALVLFADVDFADRWVVAERRAEWAELFRGGKAS